MKLVTGLEKDGDIWIKPRRVYKLVSRDMCTYGKTKWKIGQWKETNGEGRLCGPGFLHCYVHPFIAILLNSRHVDFKRFYLFEGEAKGKILTNYNMKLGVTKLRITKKIEKEKIEKFLKYLHVDNDIFYYQSSLNRIFITSNIIEIINEYNGVE